MQYFYHPEASSPMLELTGDEHRYLFRVRRHKEGEQIALRNLSDQNLYHFVIESLDKKSATLRYESHKELIIMPKKYLHLGWCIIDPKSIERVLPSLNEIGVAKITFIYCQRSQKSFKPDFKRLEKILLNSSQQSGRSVMMELAIAEDLESFAAMHPESRMLNFSKEHFLSASETKTIVIGCEGGFHDDEIMLFGADRIIGFNTPLVLKSESAVFSVASKLLL